MARPWNIVDTKSDINPAYSAEYPALPSEKNTVQQQGEKDITEENVHLKKKQIKDFLEKAQKNNSNKNEVTVEADMLEETSAEVMQEETPPKSASTDNTTIKQKESGPKAEAERRNEKQENICSKNGLTETATIKNNMQEELHDQAGPAGNKHVIMLHQDTQYI